MTDKIMVRALRPFDNGNELKDETSKPFEVSRQRFAELKANGLVIAENGDDADRAPEDASVEDEFRARISAASEAADRAIALHEARAREAGEAADREIEAHVARTAEARSNADAAVREQEARVTEATNVADAAVKQAEAAENKQAADPANKAAPKSGNKAG